MRHTLSVFLLVLAPGAWAQDAKDRGNDATQSFVSPFGLGTGATLSVTQKGTTVSAAVERQMIVPLVNFWQVGVSGTTDKNGQALAFSSRDKDAPGFQAKIGFGRSSFIRQWTTYASSGGGFMRQTWCRDVLAAVNRTLQVPVMIPADASCGGALSLVQAGLKTAPPVDSTGKVDTKTRDQDMLVLMQLARVQDTLSATDQLNVCTAIKDVPHAFQFCFASGKPQKPIEEQQRVYPGLYNTVTGQPSVLQWKLWGSWAPTLTSTGYRTVTDGVADLATEQHWTRLLHTGLIDGAVYYGRFAFGAEWGYGETVKIQYQNLCNTISSGTFTAQRCDPVMIGKPQPRKTWLASGALALNPLPLFSSTALFSPGTQVNFTYETPKGGGGHKSQLAVPLYLAPARTPLSFVFGIQPTWDWNTDPKVGNKFSVSLFIGARPEVTK